MLVSDLRTAWELSAGMLSFVVAIILGWWFGRTLDAWLGTSPWLVVLFSVCGLAAGLLNVYRAVRRAMAPPTAPGGPGDRPTRRADRPGAGSNGSE